MYGVSERLIPSVDGGLDWDVHVCCCPDRYDAVTILRMVKLVNRRGMVRFFYPLDGGWHKFVKQPERIAGVDDRLEWVEEQLADNDLHVSFSDRFEARKFAFDLNSLGSSTISAPSEAELASRERARAERRMIADQHVRNDYPASLTFECKDGWQRQGFAWLVMIHPHHHDPAKIEAWMRKKLEGRYWPAVWLPGQAPRLIKKSYRYWHLRAAQWQTLINLSRATDSLLIVHFMLKTDIKAFDRAYGPSSLL